MDRKGFPESYDMEMLIDFLNRVKSGQEEIKVPVYSHDVYDIIPDKYELIQQPDILIVEGSIRFNYLRISKSTSATF